jgi:hypothetical protein
MGTGTGTKPTQATKTKAEAKGVEPKAEAAVTAPPHRRLR